MLRIKKGRWGARVDPVTARTLFFLILKEVMDKYQVKIYEVSGGLEGEHDPGSLHFVGLAWDISIRSPGPVIVDRWDRMFKELKFNLGDDFDVVSYYPGSLRLHGEFQPKRSFGKL